MFRNPLNLLNELNKYIGAYSDFMDTVLPDKVIIHDLTRYDSFRYDELLVENVQEEFLIL